MLELNQFCQEYLPKYFASKYHKHRPIQFFASSYEDEGSIYELTVKNIKLLDMLSSINPQLQASKFIQTYLIFRPLDFKKYRCQIQQNHSQYEDQCIARSTIRKRLKMMSQLDRMCFQMFARLTYFYFETKNAQQKNSQMRHQSKEIKSDYFGQITGYLMDVKFLAMTEQDSFNSSSFMEYCINLLLSLDPTQNFLIFVSQIISESQISPQSRDRINYKIDQVKKNKLIQKLQKQKKSTSFKKQKANSQPQHSEARQKKSSEKHPTNSNENPQKKQRQQTDNRKQEGLNALKALKMNLQLQKNKSFNYRDFHLRRKYISTKRSYMQQAQPSDSDFQNQEEYEQFVDRGVLKTRKKVKVDETSSKMFDDNGKFVPDS